MAIAVGSAADHLHHQPARLQSVDGFLDLVVAQVQHRVAVRLLVAPESEGVQRERVRVRRLGGLLLLDQNAQDAPFAGGERGPLLRRRRGRGGGRVRRHECGS